MSQVSSLFFFLSSSFIPHVSYALEVVDDDATLYDHGRDASILYKIFVFKIASTNTKSQSAVITKTFIINCIHKIIFTFYYFL